MSRSQSNMVSLAYFNASLKNLVPASLCLKVVSITLTISVLKIHNREINYLRKIICLENNTFPLDEFHVVSHL